VGDDRLRHAAGGEQPRIEARDRDDHQDLRDQEHRALDDPPELAQSNLAVHHHGDEQRVDHRDACGLGRREHPAINARRKITTMVPIDQLASLVAAQITSQRARAVSGMRFTRA